MLNYKYKSIQSTVGLTLHTEKLTFTSQMKDFLLRLLSTKRIFVNSGRGPARVQSRLLENLKNCELEIKHKTDWVLNISSKENWAALDLQSTNLIIGPNVEFEKSFVKERIQSFANAVILVPSDWVIPVLKSRLQCFKGKYLVWRSDLDVEYWKPSKFRKKKFALIYRKYDQREEDFRKIVTSCESLGLKYKVITYGNYTQSSFRRHLRRSYFAIWLGTTESQGIALLESWSTNTPTFVRENSKYVDEVSGATFLASSAPYLTDACGEFFDTENFDTETVKKFLCLSKNLKPRKYVLENYSKSKINRDLNALFKELYS